MGAKSWRRISDAMTVFASSEANQKAYLDSFGYKVPIKDDLAEDFSFLVESLNANGKGRYFAEKQLELISEVSGFFDGKSGDVDPDFWLMGTQSCIDGWDQIRSMAKRYQTIDEGGDPDIFEEEA